MKYPLLRTSTLFVLMLITGVFWGTWFTLTRTIEDFTAAEFIHIGKVIIANVAVPMRIIMPVGILLMLLSLWLYNNKQSAGLYAGVLSFVLIIVVLLATLVVLVPIDNNIKEWTALTVPQDWESIRDKWKMFHAVRTFASLASFALFSWSVVSAENEKKPDNLSILS